MPSRVEVDPEDEHWLSKYVWHERRFGSKTYAAAKAEGRTILLHRLILGLTDTRQRADHIDGNGLNNRRANLRLATPSENGINSGPRAGRKYKGVSRHRDRWRAIIRYQYKQQFIGSFATEIEAARAYDERATELFGEFAYLNFGRSA